MRLQLLTAGLVSAAFVSLASANLVITEVAPQSNAGGPNTTNGDWWELYNAGTTAIDLGGYKWTDTEDRLDGPTPQANIFPSFLLQPGQAAIVLEEPAANETLWRAKWSPVAATVTIFAEDEMIPDTSVDPINDDTFSGLGSSNDGLFLYNPAGTLLDSFAYDAQTRGVSFEIAANGVDLGLSVVGENGAILSTNNEVGSPGFVVIPEPAALGIVAGVGLLAARRRRA